MPPKTRGARAAAAPKAPPQPPPLSGCVIALSGTVPGRTQATIEKDYITPLGATLAKSVTADTTHLVTTEADYNKPSAKVKSAKTHSVSIVNFQWIQDCLDKTARVPEDDYSFEPSLATPSVSPPAKTSRKRTATQSDTKEDKDSKPQPQKKSKSVVASPPEDTSKEKEAKVAEGQIAKSSDVKIPIDEGALVHLPSLQTYQVYIDGEGLIYDASLNQTNASNNNNKFYRLQLLRSSTGKYLTWTRWGRVGEYGQTKVLDGGSLENAMRDFQSKFKSKSGLSWADRGHAPKAGKYAFIERSYEPDSDDDDDDSSNAKGGDVKDEEEDVPDSKLPKATQELMELIFNQQFFAATMAHLNYDAKKLPLGKLSKTTISRGFQALKDLSVLLDDPGLANSQYQMPFDNAVEQLSNVFYTIIPHSFGRNRPPIIRNHDMLKKEIELLESLGDMKDASLLMKTDKKDTERINMLDQQFQGLGMDEMTPLKKESDEFRELKQYLMDTRGATHNADYQVAQIFRIERQGENDRFEKSEFSGPPRNRRLLWHGSRCTNFGGILSQGLRIAPPEAPVTGYVSGY